MTQSDRNQPAPPDLTPPATLPQSNDALTNLLESVCDQFEWAAERCSWDYWAKRRESLQAARERLQRTAGVLQAADKAGGEIPGTDLALSVEGWLKPLDAEIALCDTQLAALGSGDKSGDPSSDDDVAEVASTATAAVQAVGRKSRGGTTKIKGKTNAKAGKLPADSDSANGRREAAAADERSEAVAIEPPTPSVAALAVSSAGVAGDAPAGPAPQPDIETAGPPATEPEPASETEPATPPGPVSATEPEPEPEPDPVDVETDALVQELEEVGPAGGYAEYLQRLTEAAMALWGANTGNGNGIPPTLRVQAAEAQLIAARLGLLQYHNADLVKRERRLDLGTVHVFATLTRIAQDRLNPHFTIHGLKREVNQHWSAEDWARVLRDGMHERLAALEDQTLQREREARERERREQQERKDQLNRELADEIVHEIEDFVAELDSANVIPETPELVTYVRETVDGLLQRVPAGDGDLIDRVANALGEPCALLFGGKAFRRFRKRLTKLGYLAEGQGTEVTAVDTEPDRNGDTSAASKSSRQKAAHSATVEETKDAYTGLRAVMVGGTPREERRAIIQKWFGFDSLIWEGNERGRQADGVQIAERVRGGRYDVVLYLARFCAHSVQEQLRPSCKESNVPYVFVPNGYGITAIATALTAQWNRQPA